MVYNGICRDSCYLASLGLRPRDLNSPPNRCITYMYTTYYVNNNGQIIIMSKFQAEVVHVGQEKHTVPTNQQKKSFCGDGKSHFT